MKTIGRISCLATCSIALHLSGAQLCAQSAPQSQAVPLSDEQHHHLVFENKYVRVYHVAVPPHESTLLHQHDQDYLYVVFGPSEINNAVAGKSEARLPFQDGEIHFSRGPFAHIVQTESDTPFRNVTIELLHKQGAARNLCGNVIPGDGRSCGEVPAASVKSRRASGKNTAHYTLDPWFETDELRVDAAELGANRKFQNVERVDRLLVVLEKAELEASSEGNQRLKLHSEDVLWLPATTAANIKNMASSPARFVLISFKDSAAPSLR